MRRLALLSLTKYRGGLTRRGREPRTVRRASCTRRRYGTSALGEITAEQKTELGFPQAVLNSPNIQDLRILGCMLLESRDFAFGVIQRNADMISPKPRR
jgi:hypothetical protein